MGVGCLGQLYILYTENMAHIQDGTQDANEEDGEQDEVKRRKDKKGREKF